MSGDNPERMREMLDAVYRAESRRVLATLIRLLGDFDLAEEALQDAFRAALEQWPRDGVPANPRAWLVSAGRFKAIDGIRVAGVEGIHHAVSSGQPTHTLLLQRGSREITIPVNISPLQQSNSSSQ